MTTPPKQTSSGDSEDALIDAYLAKVRALDTSAWHFLSMAYDKVPYAIGRAALGITSALQWAFLKRGAEAQVSLQRRNEYARLWREIADCDRPFASRVRVGSGLTALSLLKANEQKARHTYDLSMGQVIPFQSLVDAARKP